VTVAVLIERMTEEFHFHWGAFLPADGSRSMCQGRKHGTRMHSDTGWCRLSFLYTLCQKEPYDLHLSVARKGRWPLNSVSMMNLKLDVVEVVKEFFLALQVHGARSRMCHSRDGTNTWA
jgi:hypothetical protein